MNKSTTHEAAFTSNAGSGAMSYRAFPAAGTTRRVAATNGLMNPREFTE